MYRGDYVGGYGDPGFFGSIGRALGSVAKVVVPAVFGTITKGPVAGIAGAIAGATSATRSNIEAATLGAGPSGSAYTPALRKQHAAVVANAKLGITRPVGATSLVGPHQYAGRIPVPQGPGVTARGFHLDKRTHSHLVRNRRMNWANPRALARAERRAHSFLKHAARFIRYFKPQHPKGRPYIHKKARKR